MASHHTMPISSENIGRARNHSQSDKNTVQDVTDPYKESHINVSDESSGDGSENFMNSRESHTNASDEGSGNGNETKATDYTVDLARNAVPFKREDYTLEIQKSETRRSIRSAHLNDDKTQGALFTPTFLKQAIFMSLWFFASFTSIVLNKYLLSTLDVDAGVLGECQILMTTFFGGLMMYVPHCMGRKRIPYKNETFDRFKFFKTICILGCLRCGAVICSVIGLKYVAVSFSETIKSSAPIFTALFAYALIGEYSGVYANLSLLPIMFGLAISTYTEISFNMTGFTAAITNNLLDCIQNVFSKKLLCGDDMKFSPLELQFYTSVAAAVVQLPIWFLFIDISTKFQNIDQHVGSILIFNGVIFYLQSLFAYSLMSLISPVTFSVSNTVKRACLIWFSILVFENKVTLLNLFGTFLVVFGVFLYQRARLVGQSKRERLIADEMLHHGNKKASTLPL